MEYNNHDTLEYNIYFLNRDITAEGKVICKNLILPKNWHSDLINNHTTITGTK